MKKLLLVIPLLFLVSCAVPVPEGDSVCFERHCFEVEVARTPKDRAYGLMFRQHLDEDKGMLFMFEDESQHLFWMKNTLIPLDIIWLDSDYRVVFISKDTPPCKEDICPTYGPRDNTLHVLEINAGVADEIGLEVGDIAVINIEDEG